MRLIFLFNLKDYWDNGDTNALGDNHTWIREINDSKVMRDRR